MEELVQEIQLNKVIDKEDLALIAVAKAKFQEKVYDAERAAFAAQKAALEAQKAALEARLADETCKNVIGHMYIEYGLALDDQINDETGLVTKLVALKKEEK